MFRQLRKEIQLPWSTYQVDEWVQRGFEMVARLAMPIGEQ